MCTQILTCQAVVCGSNSRPIIGTNECYRFQKPTKIRPYCALNQPLSKRWHDWSEEYTSDKLNISRSLVSISAAIKTLSGSTDFTLQYHGQLVTSKGSAAVLAAHLFAPDTTLTEHEIVLCPLLFQAGQASPSMTVVSVYPADQVVGLKAPKWTGRHRRVEQRKSKSHILGNLLSHCHF